MDRVLNQSVITKDSATPIKVKSLDENTGRIEGIANKYGRKDSDREILLPGVFAKSLAARNVCPVLMGHNPNEQAGFAKLWETPTELRFEAQLERELPAGQRGIAYVKAALGAGYDPGVSVGFKPFEDGVMRVADPGADFYDARNPPKSMATVLAYKSAELFEISIVTFPASVGSCVTSLKQYKDYAGYRNGELNHEVDYSRLYRAMEVPSGPSSTEDELDWSPVLRALALPDDTLSVKEWEGAREALVRVKGDNARRAAKEIVAKSNLTPGKRVEILDLAQQVWKQVDSVGELKTMDDLNLYLKKYLDELKRAA